MGSSQVALIAFGSSSLIAWAIGLLMRDLLASTRQGATSNRLRREQNVFDQPAAKSLGGRIDQGFDRLVLETGYELSPVVAFLVIVASGILVGGLVMLATDNALPGVAAGMAGMALPLAWFSIQRTRRMWAIRQQLPDVLDMLARSTRAGRSVEQAIDVVGEEAGGVLGPEFKTCSRQLDMGRSFDRVLKSFANRVRLVDLRIFTTTLIVQRRSGGHLSETLERMASVVRDRLSARRQIKAATGAGRMSTLVIASIAPIAYLAVFAIQPKHMAVLYDDPFGRLLLMIACVLETIGLIWVFALLRRED